MNKLKIFFILPVIWICFTFSCNSGIDRGVIERNNNEVSFQNIKPPKEKQLVAILGFENKSTYASDKLWDTSSQLLFTNLIETGYFRVVEWEKMKQLFDWDALSTSSLVKSPEKRNEARKILLCEYFLTGAVTYFDVSQRAKVSALSKSKVFQTTIRVDLLLQNAQTGEYVAAGKGESIETQEFTGGFLGGATGSWDPKTADKALDTAIRQALFQLVDVYNRKERNEL
ncbi:MAG: CsgG/HfaB family protein [Nitrospirota bacterium]